MNFFSMVNFEPNFPRSILPVATAVVVGEFRNQKSHSGIESSESNQKVSGRRQINQSVKRGFGFDGWIYAGF
ncbi:MAG: hypothetical protein ACPGYJ_10475, partial [bacterium]